MTLKDHFIKTVADELDHLNGTEFENLCRPFIEILTDKEFEIKGHNLEMKPVRRSVDLLQDGDFGVIGQCGTDKDYFSGDKAIKDIDGSLRNCPNFHTIYLFSNRRATGSELPDLEIAVKDKLDSIKRKHVAYQYHIYDSQRIAKNIFDNIYKTDKVKEILSVLPKSYEYYLIMPESNTLPMQKSGYKHRPEETEIEKSLRVNDFLQIYGLSGMGKTQTAIAVANNLSDQFDTVIWLDDNSLVSGSLSNVHIKRMGESINLETMLGRFRMLIVVDNFNDDVESLMTDFLDKSKNGSKCIVTSLQRNVSAEAFHLKYLSDDVSKEILKDCKVTPTEEQLKHMLANVAGYPLLLKLAKKAVENGDMSWDEIVSFSDLTGIEDNEKNMAFAERIVGRFRGRFKDMFNLLLGLDSTRLSRFFLRETNAFEFNTLLKYAIIEDVDDFSCSIHSIVLSAIWNVAREDYSERTFLSHLDKYLGKHVFLRDAGLYTFTAAHADRLLMLLDDMRLQDSLRKKILLACLYLFDTYTEPHRYITLFDKVELHPSESELDLRLLAEFQEIEEKKLKSESNDEEFRKDKILNYIKILEDLHTDSSKSEALRYHHIGKWLSNIKRYEEAEKFLLKAIDVNPKSFQSHLRLARDYNKQSKSDELSHGHKKCCRENAAKHLISILDKPDLSEVPLSVRLSAYEIIGGNAYADLRKRFIDECQEQFAKDIHASLSERYSLTYSVLSILGNHLSYNNPDFYFSLCAKLPMPLNIEQNLDMRRNYGKIVLAQYLYRDFPDEYQQKLFRLVEEYLVPVRDNDFVRRDLIKLYLKAGVPDKADPILGELDENNEFNLQSLCKVCCAKGDFANGLEYIAKALSKDATLWVGYRAAFLHDKAICLHGLASPEAEAVMKEAIDLQPNPKTKDEWLKELSVWMQ